MNAALGITGQHGLKRTMSIGPGNQHGLRRGAVPSPAVLNTSLGCFHCYPWLSCRPDADGVSGSEPIAIPRLRGTRPRRLEPVVEDLQEDWVEHWRGIDEIPASWGRCALTIGVFDGVHRGHQALIREAVADRSIPWGCQRC